jgi:hypothetical protein
VSGKYDRFVRLSIASLAVLISSGPIKKADRELRMLSLALNRLSFRAMRDAESLALALREKRSQKMLSKSVGNSMPAIPHDWRGRKGR